MYLARQLVGVVGAIVAGGIVAVSTLWGYKMEYETYYAVVLCGTVSLIFHEAPLSWVQEGYGIPVELFI